MTFDATINFRGASLQPCDSISARVYPIYNMRSAYRQSSPHDGYARAPPLTNFHIAPLEGFRESHPLRTPPR
ncbi:hypothetical protein EMIT0111MI5_280001 [Burkholderia sp. IT-111MI5]